MRELAEDQRTPGQPPHLVGVRQWNAAADPQIFAGELLEQVADHPHHAAQEKPEQHGPQHRPVERR